ncbi:probable enoyl-CoA hydratase 1, peroxisomal [Vicia villosa]|uniref:probable enoyl-CoA hydratase 1, peroxisomal n=1 Tax=Vicia villosa TaxID=3911 RepID=UPI00273C5546|nr:probable enoyl-CoA hydratase 1, peroxisomal [Vicia villosa]
MAQIWDAASQERFCIITSTSTQVPLVLSLSMILAGELPLIASVDGSMNSRLTCCKLTNKSSLAYKIIQRNDQSNFISVDLTAAEDVFKGDVKDPESDPVVQMERCRKPIIGAIKGFAVTAGFEIALACDILVAAKGAKFMDTHARFGIFPSWGLSQKLSRIVGVNKAREVSLTATPLTAEVAEKLGLVNHVVEEGELMKKSKEIAEAIVKNNQDLVLKYKSVINDGIKLDLGHALSLEKVSAIAFVCLKLYNMDSVMLYYGIGIV